MRIKYLEEFGHGPVETTVRQLAEDFPERGAPWYDYGQAEVNERRIEALTTVVAWLADTVAKAGLVTAEEIGEVLGGHYDTDFEFCHDDET